VAFATSLTLKATRAKEVTTISIEPVKMDPKSKTAVTAIVDDKL
jgi:hypothetical protein